MSRKKDIQEQDKEKGEQASNLMFQALLYVRIAKIPCCPTLFVKNADFIMEDKF